MMSNDIDQSNEINQKRRPLQRGDSLSYRFDDTLLCDFCNMYVESIKYFVGESHILRGFWTEIQMFLNLKQI